MFAYPELTLRFSATRYRVEDLAIFFGNNPENASPVPPNVVIDALSPDDRWSHVIEKFDEYVAWGVVHIWLADPGRKRLHIYDRLDLRRADYWEIPGLGVHLDPDDVF